MKNKLTRFSISGLFLALFTMTFLPAQTWAVCGDAVVDAGETCDYGTAGQFIDIFADGINGPIYFARDNQNSIFIAQYNVEDNVLQYDVDGNLMGEFISDGAGTVTTDDDLADPWGILIGPDGSFYVASSGDGKVLHYASDGSFINIFVDDGSGTANPDDDLACPTEIIFGPDGNFYAADGCNGKILRYAPDGNFIDIFVDDGSGTANPDDDLGALTEIIFGPDGNFYVADEFFNKVLRYATDGSFIDIFINNGTATGSTDDDLDIPRTMLFGPDGLIYLASARNNRILRYDENGNFVDLFINDGSATGSADDDLNWPIGMFFDETGFLYISNFDDNRILRFAGIGNNDSLPNFCRTDCSEPICGDGIVDDAFGEACDDGNLTDGDGCDASCQIEIEPQGTANDTGGGCILNPASSTSLLPYAWFVLGLGLLGWKRVRR